MSRKEPNDIQVPALWVSTILDRNVTAVWVSFESTDSLSVVGAVGSSKRHPGDVYDQQIALDLATSRALRALSNKLQKRANRGVAEADAKRAAVERAANPPEPRLTKAEWTQLKQAAPQKVVSSNKSRKGKTATVSKKK